MRIGLTFDLRSQYLAEGYGEEETAEFDHEDTLAAVEDALSSLGHEPDRIGHVRQLAARLVAGDRWDLVFNIAEGLRGVGREAQVPALLDAWDVPYTFSDPLVLALTLHKGLTKRVVRDAGVPTADFAVVQEIADLEGVDFEPPWFVKPVAEGTGKGITERSLVTRRDELAPLCAELLETFGQPALVERFLPGREFTVGIRGSGPQAQAIGTMEVVVRSGAPGAIYAYETKENWEGRVEYRFPRPADDPVVAEAERVALQAWRALGCLDAGRLDLRCGENGQPCFIEVNPLAGIRPGHSDLVFICEDVGLPYRDLIDGIVRSATSRAASARRGRC